MNVIPNLRFLRRAWLPAVALLLALTALAPAGLVAAVPQLQEEDCTGSIAGQVTDASGAGIEGVRVIALPMATAIRPVDPNVEPPEALTDEEGNYVIEGLCAGGYRVIALLEDPNRPLRGFHDADADGAPDILVLGGDDITLEEIDITLGTGANAPDPGRPVPAPRQCAIDDGAISGTVSNRDGDGVAGAIVMAFQATASGMPSPNLTGTVRALTDENGDYALEGMCEGDYFVNARLATSAGTVQGHYDSDNDGKPNVVGLSEAERKAADIDITLNQKVEPPNAPNPGRPAPAPRQCAIDDGVIKGTVTDTNGDTVEGAEVSLISANGAAIGGSTALSRRPAITDADGNYVIKELCEGSYAVMARLRTAAGEIRGWHDADGDGGRDLVKLSEDMREAGGIDIVLNQKVRSPNVPDPGNPSPRPQPQPQPPRAPRCAIDDGAISGTITDAAGNTVAGAQVLAIPASAATAAGSMPTAPMPVLSDVAGSFAFEGLCEGSYQVLAFQQSNSGMRVGFHDADGDGRPDRVALHPNARSAEGVDVQLVALSGPGFPIDRGRTLPLPKPVPLPLPPASRW